jgi:hypothetical protein
MKASIIDLHLMSVNTARTRDHAISHCEMVTWLADNFIKIKSEEVTYQDYLKKGNSNGIYVYNEESFNNFKTQEYP